MPGMGRIEYDSIEEASAALEASTPFCNACGKPTKIVVEKWSHDSQTGEPIEKFVAMCSEVSGIMGKWMPDYKYSHFVDEDFAWVRRS